MGNPFRVDRVSKEIKRSVNEILKKTVRDPRVQGVTITDVKMTGDLSVARIYYTIFNELTDTAKIQVGLSKSTGVIKRKLGDSLEIYKIPHLVFIKDESLEYGNKIDQILRNLDIR